MPPDRWQRWRSQLMVDEELTWLNGRMAADDL